MIIRLLMCILIGIIAILLIIYFTSDYDICYGNMEDLGIAIFNCCIGIDGDNNICSKCPYYSPIDLREENIMNNRYEYVSKKYEYDGKIYCEDNLSKEVDNYGGNIYDLYIALSRDHLANEKNDGDVTYYYAMDGAYDYENYYDLIELDFGDLEVNAYEL